MIPFAPYEPDRSKFSSGALTSMVNALPVRDGWGPLASLEAYSLALPGRCLGAVYVRTAAGFFSVIAGTQTGLYRLNGATLAWDDISGTGGPFNVADSDRWSFARFGQLLVATQINNPPQVYDIDAGGNFAPMGGNPPQAKYAWAAGSFLVLGHLQNLPSRLQWSGLEDLSFWEVGKRGSDYQDLPDGEDITGGIPEPQGAVILQRRAIRQMRFMGGEYTFGFAVRNPARGCVAPHSIVQIRAGDFVFLTEDGFFRGTEGAPIGAERVDRTFLNLADLDTFSLVRGVNDPIEKTVWWQFTRAGIATTNLIGYDWQLDRWFYSDIETTELVSLVTPGTTLEGLDAVADLDNLPYSLDSRVWKGGRPTFGGFLPDNRLGFFQGPLLATTLETTTAELTPGQRTLVQGCRFVVDSAEYTAEVAGLPYHGATETYTPPASPSARTGVTPFRSDARLHKFRINMAAGATWRHLEAAIPQAQPSSEV